MGLIVNILFLAVSFITLAIASGFCANGTRLITTIPGYDGNSKLKTAHKWGTIGSVIGWIVVVLLILSLVLFIIFGTETVEMTGGIFVTGMLLLALLGTILVGVFCAIAANDVKSADVPDNKSSYKNLVIAAVLAIVVFVVVLGLFLYKLFHKAKPKQTEEDSTISKLKAELGEGGEVSSPSWFQSAVSKGELAGEFAGEI